MWIEELPNGKFKYFERYQDPYTEKLKRVSITLTSKSNQAKKQALLELQEKIEKSTKRSNQKSLCFGEAVDIFLIAYGRKVKSSSFISFKSSEKKIRSVVGEETLIKNIDAKFLRKKMEHMFYVEKYSFNYVKKIKSLVIAILENAKEEGYNVEIPKFRLNLKKEQIESPEKYLENYEVRKIIDELSSYSKNIRKAYMVEFMVLTGLRYGELIALREEDLFDGYIKVTGTIDFRSGHYSEIIRTPPKTNAAFRNVSLPNRAVDIIITILQENEVLKMMTSYNDQGYIFTNKKGNPIDYRTFAPAFKRAVRVCNINKPVTSHWLRHTHISILAEMNVPIKTVMERVGHTDESTTLRIYTHVTNKMQTNLIDQLNTLNI
jgi:integrase